MNKKQKIFAWIVVIAIILSAIIPVLSFILFSDASVL